MLKLYNINESFVRFECPENIQRELSEFFSFKIPNARWNPKVKAGFWDGVIRLIDNKNKRFQKGLVKEVYEWCKDNQYEIEFDQNMWNIYENKLHYIKDKFPITLTPRDYQEEYIETLLKRKRALLISPTSSGKSLIMYLALRELQENVNKILVIVPTINLVTQLASDFDEYSNDNWSSEEFVHQIVGGSNKNSEKQIYISTWQSIYKLGVDYFEQFDAVIVDEVHTFEAKSGTHIMNCCINAQWKIGLSGTLEETQIHEMSLKALFGPIYSFITTKELIDRKEISDVTINAVVLKYKEVPSAKLTYQEEMKWLIQNQNRKLLITKLNNTLKGNILVLVNNIIHGKDILKELEEKTDRECYFVYGGTDPDIREKIRKLVDKKNNCTIIAIYKVFQAGVNIKNLNHIIFGYPTKSIIRLLQSIGRGLRKSDIKDHCDVWDLVDDLRGKRKTKNYCIEHFEERYRIYNNQKFNIKIKEINI